MFLRHMFEYEVLYAIMISYTLMETGGLKERSKNAERHTLQSYCKSFKSCHDCKKSTFQCEWCHEVGCTGFPHLHCPKRLLLDHLWKKHMGRYCTEIVTKALIFVPANVRRFIKIELKVDDQTLYQHNVVCEIEIEQQIIQVTASLDINAAYCDVTKLNTNRKVVVAHLKLIWGGIEPFSNTVLLLVYNCQVLAENCKDCLALSSEYNCGWCMETRRCSLIEECPRQHSVWKNRSLACDSMQIYQYRDETKRYFLISENGHDF